MRYLLLVLPLSLLTGCYYPYSYGGYYGYSTPYAPGFSQSYAPADQLRATDLCASLPGSSVILRWRETAAPLIISGHAPAAAASPAPVLSG